MTNSITDDELERLNEIASSGILAVWRGTNIPGFVQEGYAYSIVRFRRGKLLEAWSLMAEFINDAGDVDSAAVRLFEKVECGFKPVEAREAWSILASGL